MTTVWASLLGFALAYAGMSCLSFAMDRHHEQLTRGREVPARRRVGLRVVGAALLVAAIVPCVTAWGATVGPVAWLGFLSAGALPVALLLTSFAPWLIAPLLMVGGAYL
ncbi:DUF3325 domain-containing protein, partial [Acidovorax cavernicola]